MAHTMEAPTRARSSSRMDLRSLAIRHLRERRDFRVHLTIYVLVNTLLWLIWGILFATVGLWFPWPAFPLLGWGIGLAFHARETYRASSGTEIEMELTGPFTEEAIERDVARVEDELASR